MRHGRGKAIFAEGGFYDGPWRLGHMHCEAENEDDDILGLCSWLDGNGTHYCGSVISGNREGYGRLTLQNGEVYLGNFENNLYQDDHATLTGPHPLHKYTGSFKQGLRCGKGEQRYANGCSYIGDWKNDLFHGTQGVFNGHDGNFLNVASGSWKDGMIHGWATMKWEGAHPMTYTGPWIAGCACGENGELVFADGRRFKGNFSPEMKAEGEPILHTQQNQHPHILRIARGQGILTHPNGKIVKGVFREMVIRKGRPMSAVLSIKPRLLPRAPRNITGKNSPRKKQFKFKQAAPSLNPHEEPELSAPQDHEHI